MDIINIEGKTMITIDGISTTKIRGSFRTEEFYSKLSRCWLVQWDYRDQSGDLHTGISLTIEGARKAAAIFGYGQSVIVRNSQDFPNV
jgi:hypothetical protein